MWRYMKARCMPAPSKSCFMCAVNIGCQLCSLPQWTASPEEALEVAIWLNDKCEWG